ncbi:DUF4442 domain-containing protein [Leptospira gomenensis]|uniref:DUF4442 domain-containing protein n=1 Tax=Leptospira gomenensis TaxID=2484974 RepID=A0A5F1Z1T6_9LEPT|nr:DUF4442 domain-containing protein [Leptospira gomenensis]TGK36448.1 DUF4442 domain-containing protein [Leptospira gomenensis]TGK38277.1 DUF4442 domain-containing protein [Leptospira gomenensis]TGK46018.1 DUF4442 domain-containing protein [Leptospira gomenensis]TGK65282.1 DUF4442 domain-containing protein [Leptospira gomenensis]
MNLRDFTSAFLFQMEMLLKLPVYWRCGGRVSFLSGDYKTMKVKLPLIRKTKGLMGTHFGGSLYAFVDPIPLFLLKRNLDDSYILWDIEGSIRYLKATTEDVFAEIRIREEDLERIQTECDRKKKTNFNIEIDVLEKDGTPVAKVYKTIYVRKKPSREKMVARTRAPEKTFEY